MAPRESTTIVLTHGGGRFANQLMLFGHLIALAEEFPWLRLVNMSFWKYAHLCAGTRGNPVCRYPDAGAERRSLLSVFPGILRRMRAVLPGQVQRGIEFCVPRTIHRCWPAHVSCHEPACLEVAMGSEEFLSRLRGRRSVALSGWFMRDWALFAKHVEPIRAFLKPAETFQSPATAFMAEVRRRHKTVVGLLMRQSDYRTWMNGEFFLTTEQYLAAMEPLRSRFGPDCGFVVATDEKQDTSAFEGLNVHWCTGEKAGPGHYLESLVELSLCDVIVSVPSTFSVWASFFGDRPMLPIASATADLAHTPLVEDHLVGAHRHPVLKRCTR